MKTRQEENLVVDANTGEILENLDEARASESDEYEPDTTYLPKMTIATLDGAPERAVIEAKRVSVIPRWTGQVTGYRIVPMKDPDGREREFYALIGRFKAENYAGKQYRSGVAYLPGGLHEIVLERLETVKANAARFGDARGVEFAFAIDAQPQPNTYNQRAYGYRARSLTPVSKADPLEALWERTGKVALAASGTKSLPAARRDEMQQHGTPGEEH